jgi:hypothetical protein
MFSLTKEENKVPQTMKATILPIKTPKAMS